MQLLIPTTWKKVSGDFAREFIIDLLLTWGRLEQCPNIFRSSVIHTRTLTRLSQLEFAAFFMSRVKKHDEIMEGLCLFSKLYGNGVW
mgnify:CR=1 FL=1